MKKAHLYILLFVTTASIIGLCLMEPIPQDPAYHNYADQRTIFGIPYFWNVVSNLFLFFLGASIFFHTLKHWNHRPDTVARLIPLTFSLGIFVACFGSAYYHWMPNNLTLVWDRLPMTLMFMPLLSLLIYDFLGERAGRTAFWLLVPLGLFSVFYWHWTELQGRGDLRLYAFVQFFPMLIAPVLVLVSPKKVPYVRYILLVIGWYALAKICETLDHEIFHFTKFWSGHTIKHLMGAVSLWYAMKLVHGWNITKTSN